jgi:predicted negative regulator of RcsB-dependent stress response
VDKQLREQLKHDKFVEEVGHTVHYLTDHKAAVKKYGGVVAGVLALALGVYGFMNWREGSRQDDLRQAALTLDAFIGDQSPTGGLAFKTQTEKDAAILKAMTEVANKHDGTKEGQLARLYATQLICDQGKVAECEAGLRKIATGGDHNVATLAKLSLTELLLAQGKNADAETFARDLVNNPSAVVSKEQGQLAVARSIAKTKPQEAQQILQALQALDRPAITRAAVALMGEVMGQQLPR